MAAAQPPGPTPLLPTKLYIPRTRTPLVARPRLVALLDGALTRKLTLICAPGGFGKTVLVSEWRDNTAEPLPLGWVSLSEAENDPATFWSYVAAALDRVQPGTGSGVQSIIGSAPSGPPDSIWMACVNAVSEMPCDFALVLDDYHVITNVVIHRALAQLLDQLPPQMHLVLISRADPPLPLARLRAAGELVEVRAQDLRFTPAEAAAFLNEMKQLGLSDAQLAALGDRTEGWIAGLQMAALSMQGRPDLDRFIAAFTGSHRFIVDYLGEEVIQRQPADVQRFLMETAILQRLNGSLCDAVTGMAGSHAMLQRLEQDNLFIIQLDDQREWYRYHHLFADVLLASLREREPGAEAPLHRRAAAWFAEHGETPEAVHHALAAGDNDGAALLMEQGIDGLLRHGELKTVRDWLDALPHALLVRRPRLAFAYAEALVDDGRIDQVEGLLQAVEVAGALEESMIGQATAIRALVSWTVQDVPQSVLLCREALRLLPESEVRRRGVMTLRLAGAQHRLGDTGPAAAAYAEALALTRQAGDIHGAALIACAQADLEAERGNAAEGLALLQQGLRLCAELGVDAPAAMTTLELNLAWLLRHRRELAACERHAVSALRSARRAASTEGLVFGQLLLAFLEAVKGNADRADELVREAEAMVPPELPWARRLVAAQRAQTDLQLGRLAAAAEWARTASPLIPNDIYATVGAELETLIRAQVATGQTAAALERLAAVEAMAAAGGHAVWLMIAPSLRAVALYLEGDVDRALAELEEALARLEGMGLLGPLVECGAPMAELLRLALPQTARPDLVRSLLSLMGETAPVERVVAVERVTPAATQALTEPLSERELEVLRLVATGASNQEIAGQLFIAITTVKKHIGNIFGKLGAANRVQAMSRAQELGLL